MNNSNEIREGLSKPFPTEGSLEDHGPEDMRRDWWILIPLLVGGAAVMWLARSQWFFQDEWDFLILRDLTSLNDLIRPHTEHWSTVPIVVYRALFAAFGIDTYLPYLGVLVALNVAVGSAIAILLRRHGAPTSISVLGGLLIILFGGGAQNIAWAFQIGFVASLLLFLLTLLILSRDRDTQREDWLASGLLLGSVMSSGLGPAFAVGAGVGLLFRGQRGRALRVALLPIGAYAAWYIAFGKHAAGESLTASILLLPRYVARGLSAALESLFGFGLSVGSALFLLLVLFVIATVIGYRAWPPPPTAVSAIVALIFVYASAGVVRASEFGIEQAAVSRYRHIGGALLVVALGTHLFGSRTVPKPMPRRGFVILSLVLAVLVFDSAATLRLAIHNQTHLRVNQRNEVAAVLDIIDTGGQFTLLDEATPVFRAPQISVARMRGLLDSGTLHPLQDVDVPTQVRKDVLGLMQFAWFARRPDAPTLRWELDDAVRLSVQGLDSRCITVAAEGEDPQLRLNVDGSGVLDIRSESGGTVNAFLRVDGDFREAVSKELEIPAGQSRWLEVAETAERPQKIRIDPSQGDVLQVCGQRIEHT